MSSLRLTESCEMYKRSLKELFDDENRFVDFLRYSGRFYKLPFNHVATLYRYNPDAEMWADYETWKRYGNNVLRNQRSSAVHISGNQLKHYFEIGQTTHTTTPYQWSINKAVLQDFLSDVNLSENKTYRSLASYINRHVEQWTSDHAEDILKSFNISSDDGKAQFLKSFCTLAETVVSARCEHNSTYKYKVPDVPDLTALKTLKSPEDLERICGFVQTAAKTVLLGIERKVTKIINLQRSEQNEQHNREVSQERREAGNDMVRGGSEALSEVRLRREAGDNVSTGHTNVDIQSDNRSDKGHSDEETAGRTDRKVRQEVAAVYGGQPSRNDTAPSGQLTLGDYSEGDRQGSRGIVSDTGRSVSQAEPTPDGIYGNGEVGKNEADGNRPRDNDTDSSSVSGIIEQSNIETQTAEISEEVPAVSISEAAFATSEENKTKEEAEVRFNSVEFEKLISSNMRFKQVDLVNGNEIYWFTQDIFSPNDLKEFQQAIRNYDGNIKKFYVTPRDLSPHYTFEEDLTNSVLATVTPDEILQDDYLKAIEKAGLGEYLTPGREENRATYSTKPEDDLPRNFHITDDTLLNSWGGEKTRYNKNIEAIKLLHDLENSGRTATSEEQQVLAQYAGWGGVSKAFDPNNTSWEKEYNELKELLTPEEYAAAKSSINNAHFTNPEIIRAMYKALGNMGIKDGNILDIIMQILIQSRGKIKKCAFAV